MDREYDLAVSLGVHRFCFTKSTLTPDAYVSYLAKIKTHAGATDHEVSLLDGKLFFINGRFNRLKDEEREPEVIAEVLIDVLKGYLKNR